jgi:acyl carrier protein
MQRTEVFGKVQEIFRDILDDEDIVLTDSTSADDIEEWDSLTHIQLVVAVEKKFHLKFTSQQMLSWKNVGEMVDFITSKV